ncbi:receptor-type tyrosine-protein kinase FLT3 [Parambassis ranga]|uniref:receptor protein-tyrosine kinase n=1 Tax=Parambassis ranga TaxID=210632 RepID=A0A6P7KFZ5_9TELE|nr:receptor-type tyrosine-protein kinase FLT3 [Parambassis ranga]
MIVWVLLLFAVSALCSNGVKNDACVSTHEVTCFQPADYLNASHPVSVAVSLGKKLNISLKGPSGYSVCHWIRGADTVMTINASDSMVTSPLSEKDSGEYTLSCETNNATRSSVTVALYVSKRPTKPLLLLDNLNSKLNSPRFQCISEGSPTPTIHWSGNKVAKPSESNNGMSESSISSVHYVQANLEHMMCCANNAEGQECSQLYDYDVQTKEMRGNEVSNVTLSPGQSLLLRCGKKGFKLPSAEWEKNGRKLDSKALACEDQKKLQLCINEDNHAGWLMTYLLIRSVSAEDNGTYTCRSQNNIAKSVYINVQAEGFLAVQLDESKSMLTQNASKSCLQASVSYHPVLQQCSWEAPDGHVTECLRDQWVTQHRTVKLCEPLKTGGYKLHVEAGGQKQTKAISVCVADEPKFEFKVNGENTIETVSPTPAYTWIFCLSLNVSCGTESWNDTDVICNKPIKIPVNRSLLDGDLLKFCLTNPLGTWCQSFRNIRQPSVEAYKVAVPSEGSTMLLKIGSIVLLLALAVLSVVLLYFVTKKKPQYQPQLQMLQMVGPNDNDYIYINFKDFQYNKKWEFPRENLELGKELGSGAFGMVVHATAYGINNPGVSQQVAVKMLKEKHQSVEKEALMSELKMLTHIGHHDNIVNLLGACTELGPIYLIFQYCCYGDLLNYLKNNSEFYHKSVVDAFNKECFTSLYNNLQLGKNTSKPDVTVDTYVPMYGSTTRGQEDIALLPFTSSNDTNGYEDPESCNTTNDETEDPQTLTFDDLLCFAFQVAKGMEFLSSKNCIHRDLAARNVLVTKGRLVKIGDFGLARDIDNDSNYVVRGNVRLPVKWMAPESIFEGVYMMKSDVWAYGILLWEIFSLGVTPYPGMKVDHTFYSMIERGFKMERPYYANVAVYEMMCKCWALDPSNRPSFSKLVSFMCDQLTDREEQLYHNMPNQTSCDYQNMADISDISTLTENDNKMVVGNDYRQTHATEEKETGTPNFAAAGEEIKTSADTE